MSPPSRGLLLLCRFGTLRYFLEVEVSREGWEGFLYCEKEREREGEVPRKPLPPQTTMRFLAMELEFWVYF